MEQLSVSPAEISSQRVPNVAFETCEPADDVESIYREHFRFVWRTAKRLGVAERFLDDVAQEVFIVVHRRLGDFEGASSIKTWIYGILRRVVSDHRRTMSRKPSVGTTEERDYEAPSLDRPDHSVERDDQVRILHRVLGELDDEKREVFILTEFEQMTMAEIAEATGVNPNTVSSRLRASRKEFREALERLLGDDGRGA